METSGVDPVKNGILTLDYKVEIDGEIKAKGKILNNPVGKLIEDGALQVNGLKREQIAGFQLPAANYAVISGVLNQFVDKYDTSDKFYAGGYNVGFDVNFLRQFFLDNGDKYFGSFFFFSYIDPSALIPFLRYKGMFPDYPARQRLCDVAEYFGVINKEQLHDSEADLKMTMDVCDVVWREFFK
jgi:DNA polymerase-3 subunit epsilon